MKRIHWLGHSSFRVETAEGLNIYLDPWRLSPQKHKADLLLISHAHHDHCSPDDVAALLKPDTIIAGPASVGAALGRQITTLKPGETAKLAGLTVEAVPAYNIGKKFHPRQDGNLGFIITADGRSIYHAGDTDLIPEMSGIRADIALLPIGGTYTMNPAEAARAAAIIDPKTAIPMHYGKHVGPYSLADEFKNLCTVPVTVLPEEK